MNEPDDKKEPNMTNKLGEIRRVNVRAFSEKKHMSLNEFAQIVGISKGSMQNNFGKVLRNAPKEKTMEKIYKAFPELTVGVLDKPDFDPATLPIAPESASKRPPKALAVIPQEIFLQIGRLRTPISQSMAERILIMIALEDYE